MLQKAVFGFSTGSLSQTVCLSCSSLSISQSINQFVFIKNKLISTQLIHSQTKVLLDIQRLD